MKNLAQFYLISILGMFSVSGFAAEGSIFQALYHLRMSDAEQVSYKDFYTNVGTTSGLSIGDTLEVYRAIPMADPSSTGPFVEVVLGEVRVLAVSEKGSIVRTMGYRSSDVLPIMEYSRFMVGDVVRTKNTIAKAPEPFIQLR